jgi:Spy/CpxP family protein refolding chaperone
VRGSATIGIIAICAALVVAQQPPPQRFRWWQDGQVQRFLALTPRQVDALEREFEQGLEARRELRQQSISADQEVDRALARGDLSDAAAMVLIDRAEMLRYRRNVARTLLLARMYRLLTPDQRVKLPRIVPRPPR